MELFLNVLQFAVINSFLIGLFLIINRRGNTAANRYYGLLAWSLSAVALENILIISGEIFKAPHLFSVGAIMMLLVPPLGFLLYQHLIDPTRTTSWQVLLLHLLPFILCTLGLIPFFQLSAEIKTEIIQNVYYEHQSISGFGLFYSALNLIQFITYNILIAKNLRIRNVLKPKKSERFGLSWMGILLLTMNGIVGAYLAVYLAFIYSTAYQSILILIFITIMVSTIYLTTYQLVKNPFFFSKNEGLYKRSSLTKEVSQELDENLEKLLNTQKPYLKSGIKLTEIANQLDVSPHQLSQYLNQTKKSSFTEFINTYRIQYAQEMLNLDTKKNLTILAIALESGFGNQANFIKVFKENTGMTPSEYRNK